MPFKKLLLVINPFCATHKAFVAAEDTVSYYADYKLCDSKDIDKILQDCVKLDIKKINLLSTAGPEEYIHGLVQLLESNSQNIEIGVNEI